MTNWHASLHENGLSANVILMLMGGYSAMLISVGWQEVLVMAHLIFLCHQFDLTCFSTIQTINSKQQFS